MMLGRVRNVIESAQYLHTLFTLHLWWVKVLVRQELGVFIGKEGILHRLARCRWRGAGHRLEAYPNGR